ncbi:MAG: N-acetylmuramoyl-L-alanine amidase protein [Bacteroidetes bacterium]|nr:N-acetylmuramoyl-L-alanine amidase protein [Bacteroidota bacterium]
MALKIEQSMRLGLDQYFRPSSPKTGIAIHHTVGGSARSTFDWWMKDPLQIGTAYIIERDGTVYQVFEPEAWAWQFGLPWASEERIAFEKRFIGIEIASEGGLMEQDGQLYCFDRVSPKTLKSRNEAFDYGKVYRGYRYFDRYENVQVDSLIQLINELCDKFGIERKVPDKPLAYYGDLVKNFPGIIGHTMVRKDKSDPSPDIAFWNRVIADCRLAKTSDLGPTPAAPRLLSELEKDALFEANVHQISVMNTAAGSMVKGAIMELERNERNTYIKLRDAVPDGHAVNYDFVEGDKGLVFRIARALGFKEVTESRLEVYS